MIEFLLLEVGVDELAAAAAVPLWAYLSLPEPTYVEVDVAERAKSGSSGDLDGPRATDARRGT